MGGAMELVTGAKKVIVAMEHTTRKGEPKLVKECDYLLTGKACVDLVVTDLAVVQVTDEGFLLLETAPGYTPEDVQSVTGARLNISEKLKEVQI